RQDRTSSRPGAAESGPPTPARRYTVHRLPNHPVLGGTSRTARRGVARCRPPCSHRPTKTSARRPLPCEHRAMSAADETGGDFTGGNVNEMARVGDTVRRTSGPWTPTIHALLAWVRAQGVQRLPTPLGVDDRGREVLSYLAGETAGWPVPAWVWEPGT